MIHPTLNDPRIYLADQIGNTNDAARQAYSCIDAEYGYLNSLRLEFFGKLIERPDAYDVLWHTARLQRSCNLHQRCLGPADTETADDMKDRGCAHIDAQRRRHASYIKIVQRA